MKTPRFWQKNGIFPTLLTPLGWVYGAATQLRLRLAKPARCEGEGHLYRQHHRRRCRQDAGGDGHGGTVYQSRQESFFRYPRL